MRRGQQRGQTSIDFAISMGIILVAVVTAIAFLPLMTSSFVGLSGENTLVADRTVDQMVDYQLAGTSGPGTLDAVCTVYFFTDQSSDPCESFDAANTVREQLGLGSDVHVNVTIEQDVVGSSLPDVLCANDDPNLGKVTDPPCGSNEIRLSAGDPLPQEESVAEARRMVRLDGRQDVFVRVKVWT